MTTTPESDTPSAGLAMVLPHLSTPRRPCSAVGLLVQVDNHYGYMSADCPVCEALDAVAPLLLPAAAAAYVGVSHDTWGTYSGRGVRPRPDYVDPGGTPSWFPFTLDQWNEGRVRRPARYQRQQPAADKPAGDLYDLLATPGIPLE